MLPALGNAPEDGRDRPQASRSVGQSDRDGRGDGMCRVFDKDIYGMNKLPCSSSARGYLHMPDHRLSRSTDDRGLHTAQRQNPLQPPEDPDY